MIVNRVAQLVDALGGHDDRVVDLAEWISFFTCVFLAGADLSTHPSLTDTFIFLIGTISWATWCEYSVRSMGVSWR